MDEHPTPQSLKTSPMVVAVTWTYEGLQRLGRVADWHLTADGWSAFVITERGHRGGGWMMADQLQPSDHPVATTYGSWEWGTWQPPTWPADLTRFAGAAWNDTELHRAMRARHEQENPGAEARMLDTAARLQAGEDVPTRPAREALNEAMRRHNQQE